VSKTRLIIAIHCHQPAGNLEPVFVQAHDQCYAPFIRALERHPGVHLGLHLSGCLLEWLEQNRPELLTELARLVERRQVELLGGGFYEPVLTAIPDGDALGQLELMQDYLQDRFGVTPRGGWLAERAWEPGAGRLLGLAGLQYTLLDEETLRPAGLAGERLSGYYTTEHAGKPLAIFPADRALRYQIPFRPVAEVLSGLRALEGRGVPSLTYADDGEKLGLWPGTHAWVHQQGWLEDFLAALEENAGWLETAAPGEALDAEPPRGRIYPPAGAYPELGAWSLPCEAALRLARLKQRAGEAGLEDELDVFLRPGGFAGFAAKYDAADRLRQKMLVVSRKLATARREAAEWSEDHEQARLGLYRAQGHDATWHGLFGGVYLPHLRQAAYRDLLEAECALDRMSQGDGAWIAFDQLDLDADRSDEALVESAELNAYLAPQHGGSLTELDHRASLSNLLDVLTRRPETYHRAEPAPAGAGPEPAASDEATLVGQLGEDAFPRRGFMDRFPAPATQLEGLQRGSYQEEGDFVAGAYQVVRMGIDEEGDCDFKAELARAGRLTRDGRSLPLEIVKRYAIPVDRAEVRVGYTLRNPGPEPLAFVFCPELNLGLSTPEACSWEYDGVVGPGPRAATAGEVQGTRWIALVDQHRRLRVRLECSPAASLWRHPVESLTRTESGLVRILQGVALAPRFELALGPGEELELSLRLELQALDQDALVPVAGPAGAGADA